jgi:hypothetical protein
MSHHAWPLQCIFLNKSFIEMQTLIYILLMTVSVLQRQNGLVVIEDIWPAKLKYFTFGPLHAKMFATHCFQRMCSVLL